MHLHHKPHENERENEAPHVELKNRNRHSASKHSTQSDSTSPTKIVHSAIQHKSDSREASDDTQKPAHIRDFEKVPPLPGHTPSAEKQSLPPPDDESEHKHEEHLAHHAERYDAELKDKAEFDVHHHHGEHIVAHHHPEHHAPTQGQTKESATGQLKHNPLGGEKVVLTSRSYTITIPPWNLTNCVNQSLKLPLL